MSRLFRQPDRSLHFLSASNISSPTKEKDRERERDGSFSVSVLEKIPTFEDDNAGLCRSLPERISIIVVQSI